MNTLDTLVDVPFVLLRHQRGMVHLGFLRHAGGVDAIEAQRRSHRSFGIPLNETTDEGRDKRAA